MAAAIPRGFNYALGAMAEQGRRWRGCGFSLSLFDTQPECRPEDSPDPQAIRDGAHIVHLVDKTRSEELRYELDQGIEEPALL